MIYQNFKAYITLSNVIKTIGIRNFVIRNLDLNFRIIIAIIPITFYIQIILKSHVTIILILNI